MGIFPVRSIRITLPRSYATLGTVYSNIGYLGRGTSIKRHLQGNPWLLGTAASHALEPTRMSVCLNTPILEFIV